MIAQKPAGWRLVTENTVRSFASPHLADPPSKVRSRFLGLGKVAAVVSIVATAYFLTAAVGAHVQTVKDNGRKQGLIDKVNLLNAKVASRDRNATTPPNALPGTAPVVSATASVAVIPPGDPVITVAPNPFGG